MAVKYRIDRALCVSCGTCDMECRFGAIQISDQGKFSIDTETCRGCGLCAASCPVDAVLKG
ncbi:MAG: 4Fe-4S binding protein [Clostridia bacterium]|nr:4Fe-4S binding protein [Clostridia bacterium]